MRDASTRALVALLVALGVAGVACNKDPGPQVGQPVPDFSLPDLEGRTHRLSDLKGKVVVLNFWATWCPPCIDEMPSLDRLSEALESKGVEVVAVSVDERFSDIGEFVEKFQVTFTVLHDEGKKVSRTYQTFKYPETFILDRDGRLRSKVVGPRDWSAPTVIRDMVELLKEERAPEGPGTETSSSTEG
jgi:peroxiredoxin